jgi:hypothetical protein
MTEFGFPTEDLEQIEAVIREVNSLRIPRRRPRFAQPVYVRPAVDDPLREGVAGGTGAYLVRVFWNALGFDEHRKFAWRLEHKLVQAGVLNRFTGGAFPRTWGLARLLRQGLGESLLAALATGRFFVKRALGHLSGDWGSADGTARVLHDLRSGVDLVGDRGQSPADEAWVVQERMAIDREYRVHSFEDVVLPELTFDRYGPSPVPEQRDAINGYVQSLLDRLPGGLVGETLYGWDVAVAADGSRRVIEVNLAGFHPVYERGFQASGFFQNHQIGPPLLAGLARHLRAAYNVVLALPDEWQEGPSRHALYLRILRYYWGPVPRTAQALPAGIPACADGDRVVAAGSAATGGPTLGDAGLPPLDAVLCLRPDDVERFELLRRSVRRFRPAVGRLWVATTSEDCQAVRAAVADATTVVLSEAELIPEAARHLNAPAGRRRELAKLALVERVGSDFCLDLIPDALCTRHFRTSDLVVGGKALYFRYINRVHSERYAEAEAVLGLPRSGWVHGSTACLLNKSVVAALRRFLAAPAGTAPGGSRRGLLLTQPWVLSFVYFTFLEAFGLEDVYYVPSDRSLYGNCVWSEEEWQEWDPALSFQGQNQFYFSVVRPGRRVPAGAVGARVEPYLSD